MKTRYPARHVLNVLKRDLHEYHSAYHGPTQVIKAIARHFGSMEFTPAFSSAQFSRTIIRRASDLLLRRKGEKHYGKI